ncbi:probable cytochrome P450 317a1 [Anastrepha ludens]|uniref:probable cytochrome P450 317a1 n=1 Tax=Anastrepha ludens TaxID=28586 RepID=UPI0023AEF0E2|nr:probable cytochrome P450 317a1 [Anastrepha ludens]
MWWVWLIGVIAIAILIIFVISPLCYIVYKRNYWRWHHVPFEPPAAAFEILQHLFGLRTIMEWEELEHYDQLYRNFKAHGPFCGFYRLMQPRALILDRELIMQILIKNFSNFNDRGIYHNSKHDPLSADLYSRRGSEWKEMRLRLEPIFAKDEMRYLYDGLRASCAEWLVGFEQLVREERAHSGYIEIRTQMRRYVLTSIAASVFDLNAQRQQKYPLNVFDDMTHLENTTSRHSEFTNTFLRRYPRLGKKLKLRTTSKTVEDYFTGLIAEVVAEREQSGTDKKDYLQVLVNLMQQELSTHEVEDQTMKELKEHLMGELAAHAISFLKAGLRPTTHTLTYVLYELALNDTVQQQLRDEVEEALQRHNNELTYDCIRELKFLGQVISETIRLHPIVPYLIRRTLTEFPVSNNNKYALPKNMFIIVPTHAIHNDAEYYPEPLLFKPERFGRSDNKGRDICMWLGFGEGPRSCIGLHFAQLMMRVLLAQLITRYHFSVDRTRLMVKPQNIIRLRVDPLNDEPEGREADVVI